MGIYDILLLVFSIIFFIGTIGEKDKEVKRMYMLMLVVSLVLWTLHLN